MLLYASGHKYSTMSMIEKYVKDYVASYYRYRTEARHNNSKSGHKVISQISGGFLAIAEFRNKEESGKYSSMYSHLTTLFGAMKVRCKTWDLSPRKHKRDLVAFWIPLAD